MSNTKVRPLAQIYRLKLILVGVCLAFGGILLSVFADWLDEAFSLSSLMLAAIRGLADVMLVAGAIGIVVDFITGRAKEKADREIYREEQKELIPTYVDSVLEAFAASPEKLERVASPQLLDSLASNALSLRLGDERFAHEIYKDIRDQAIRSVERWHDVEVRIRLSGIPERSTGGAPLFDVTVEWEYTTIPAGAVRRFVCVSDREAYNDLLFDIPATLPWLMTPRPGLDASSRDCFEVLELTVDGRVQPIRRTARKSEQTYTVHLDESARSGDPVRIRQVSRIVTPQSGHRLYFELPQPARNFSLVLDYSDTKIAQLAVSESIASSRPLQVMRSPEAASGKSISVNAPGWMLPKTGMTFTWTLDAELPRAENQREAA